MCISKITTYDQTLEDIIQANNYTSREQHAEQSAVTLANRFWHRHHQSAGHNVNNKAKRHTICFTSIKQKVPCRLINIKAIDWLVTVVGNCGWVDIVIIES